MSREVHVRFWESAGVRFPRATRLQLGAALAGRWRLPEALCEVIAHSGSPPAGRQLPAHAGLVDIVHLASRLSHLLTSDFDRLPMDRLPVALSDGLAAHPVDSATLGRLGVPASYLLELLPRAARDLRRLEALISA